MTGYGRASSRHHNLEISAEISAINRRNLELFFTLPKEWLAYEIPLTNLIRNHLHRGKITITIQVKDFVKPEGISWNEATLMNSLSVLGSFCKKQNIPFHLTPELIFNITKSISTQSELPSSDELYSILEKTFSSALHAFIAMREKEGINLKTDIQSRLHLLLSSLEVIKGKSQNSLIRYKELLLQRLKAADLTFDLNDERVLKEIAIFADRSDTSEEITRIESHLHQFLTELLSPNPIGRKLDFICQELTREYNTLSAKSNNLEIIQIILDSKNELERIREQVQNIE